MRSWGGVVGIRGSLPFIDGGSLTRPEFAPFDEKGNWVIEGYGVDPDVVIDTFKLTSWVVVDDNVRINTVAFDDPVAFLVKRSELGTG